MARLKEEPIEFNSLIDSFLSDGEIEFNQSIDKPIFILDWVKNLNLASGKFDLENHPYQRDMLTEQATRQCFKKGSQVGITEVNVLRSVKGLLDGVYPQSVLYLFPTQNDVSDFSKSRFNSIISDNPQIAKYVQATDAVSIKRVKKSFLYLRGARSTAKIEGIKKTSSQLKSVPVDRICFDECDEMESAMILLGLERLGHSLVKEEIYLSTPSIPDYGISKLYDESDQRVWEIKCPHCNTGTVLEMEFPSCLIELSDGKVIRGCKRCKKEIYPKDGHWVALYPDRSKDMVGWWISQLNSAYVEPRMILKAYNDALLDKRKFAEFYNSKLGMGYVSSEQKINPGDVLRLCGQDVMAAKDIGPCCAGLDIGNLLHIVVAFRPNEKQLQICYLGRVSSFPDIHDICKRFNVKCLVSDAEPELRAVRDFASKEDFPVYVADYQQSAIDPVWKEDQMLIKLNRTASLDYCHELLISPAAKLILPRLCDEVQLFAKHCSNVAKILEEDIETGQREYRWRRVSGEDHYLHSLNYLALASQKIGISDDPYWEKTKRVDKYDTFYDPFKEIKPSEQDKDNYNPFEEEGSRW